MSQIFGIKKIDGTTVKIGLRQKQAAVLLNVPAENLPPEYFQVSYKPDLTKIRKLLKVGERKNAWEREKVVSGCFPLTKPDSFIMSCGFFNQI